MPRKKYFYFDTVLEKDWLQWVIQVNPDYEIAIKQKTNHQFEKMILRTELEKTFPTRSTTEH